MNPAVRLVLALVLLVGIAVVVVVGLGGGASPAAPHQWTSSGQCQECHQAVYDEWFGSHHQIAYTNPEVRGMSEDFKNKECQACHLPKPIAVTGYGERAFPRNTQPGEGVSCLTCHLGTEGQILGRAARPDAPCAPIQSPDLLSIELCASCHNQHFTTDQWRASSWATEGVHCNDCHMPERERAGVPGRGHGYPGCHDLAMLKTAGAFTVDKTAAGALELALENTGAGHNFPTEERHRAVDMMVRFVDGDGTASEWQRVYRFRQPYRDETGPDTQLPAGRRHVETVPIPVGAVRAEARLWYRLTPFVGDDDPRSTLLEEREVDLR